MSSKESLIDRFWTASRQAALEVGYDFGEDCRDHFFKFITEGVNRLLSEDTDPSEADLARAETNIVKYTMGMANKAKSTGYDDNLLHEDTFFGIKDRICPLWPFCD